MKNFFQLQIVVAIVCAWDTTAASQCEANSRNSGIKTSEDENDQIVIQNVQSASECFSLLSSNPDYNIFIYCHSQLDGFSAFGPETLTPINICLLQYSHAVALGNDQYVWGEGFGERAISGCIPLKNKGWNEDVVDGLSNLILNLNPQIAANYIYQMFINTWQFQIPQNVTNVIEDIISRGDCKIVFQILKELSNIVEDETQAVKLQDAFSQSKSIIDCANRMYPIVADQNICEEYIDCIFLLKATRYVLDASGISCLSQRVCNFVGFKRQQICQSQCMI